MARLDKARKAFLEKNIEEARKAHENEAIKEEPWHKTEAGRYIEPAVYGATDGIITTFAVVAGVAGASLSPKIVLILGLANLLADGLSMAVGDYLSTKSRIDYERSEWERERWEVENFPDAEELEMREIYRRKGLKEEDINKIIDVLKNNKDFWVETMMKDELGILPEDTQSPLKSSFVTFSSFALAGFIPLLAYILSYFIPFFAAHQFLIASVMTGITLFFVGALRQLVTGVKWWKGGFEMLTIGSISAVVAYLVGFFLRRIAEGV